MPVVNEQVGAEADELPKNEHHEKIIGEHDAEHRKHEDGETAEVAGLGRVFVHVAEREDVNAETDDADDHQHQRGEVIELKADREGEVAQAEPLEGFAEALIIKREQKSEASDSSSRERR